jgi:hypothetical protein
VIGPLEDHELAPVLGQAHRGAAGGRRGEGRRGLADLGRGGLRGQRARKTVDGADEGGGGSGTDKKIAT